MPSSATMLAVRSFILIICLVAIPAIALIGVPISSLFAPASEEEAIAADPSPAEARKHELAELQELAGVSGNDPNSTPAADQGEVVRIPSSTVPAFWGGGADERSYWEGQAHSNSAEHAPADSLSSASDPAARAAQPGVTDLLVHAATESAAGGASPASPATPPPTAATPSRRVPWATASRSATGNPTANSSASPGTVASSRPAAPGESQVSPPLATGPNRGNEPGPGQRPGLERAPQAGSTPNAGPSQQDAMQAVIDKLRSRGAAYFRLETWGQVSEFRCEMPLPETPRYHAFFEASDPDPLRAMEQVLAKIEHWQAQQRQQPVVASPPSQDLRR